MKPNRKKASGARFEIVNAFADLSLRDLTRAEIATWLLIWRDAKGPKWEARTSIGDIAERAGASRQAISGAVSSLQSRGLLRVVRRGGLNQGPSVYVANPVPMD